uniref:Cysteine-rich protein 1 n=1 Tax=Sarcophilus harrisii TaxID=9305 RepID=A0A7N4PA90_SARHA
MPKCPKCQKEVYFAERVTSLGKDWHRPCLKCEKCGKTLTSGGHAEALEEEVLKVIPSSKSRFWKTFSSSSASLHSTGKCQLDLTSCNQSHHQ